MANKMEITKDGLFLGGKPFYLASGDMHYFRYFKDGWKRRLKLMKDFGLTAVQTYVPWNMHEAEEGEFCFEDNLDIKAFLELCDEIGLKVMLRPSPYMCGEWDFGGLPYWLLNKKGIGIRTSESVFMNCVRKYTKRLAKEFVPYLSTNGGPVIAVAVENEYGSFSDDTDYIKQMGDMLVEFGVDVPLFTANGFGVKAISYGTLPEYWTGLDLHNYTDEVAEYMKKIQPDKPVYIAEFWAGRAMKDGGYFLRQSAEDVAVNYASMLRKGAYINFYMFCGGTNFGFMNGAGYGTYVKASPNTPKRYQPHSTSYDVDALVSEHGEATEKYYACKRELKKYLESINVEFAGTEETVVKSVKTQSIAKVKLTESADLLTNVENICQSVHKSALPCSFEELNQAYGFVLYKKKIKHTTNELHMLVIDDLKDRALVYGNGEYMGCYMRDHDSKPITFKVPKSGLELEILVENLGRINVASNMVKENKGILGCVKIEAMIDENRVHPGNMDFLSNFINYSLPMKKENLEHTDYSVPAKNKRPAIYKGKFKAIAGVDTFLNFEGWKKGFVLINGFNIGRYWNVGPQGTLYVPGELLKEENTIVMVELHNENIKPVVRFDAKPALDTVKEIIDVAQLGV